MLDVHPPHETPHGPRDFLLHLFTITIGLLIALSLEGVVEWQHHRHLVHQAEATLHGEIARNQESLSGTLTAVPAEIEAFKHDIAVLKIVMRTGKLPKGTSMNISFGLKTLDDVSWKTAQSTGALAYMPYERAQEYANIYSSQETLVSEETQAVRDTIVSLGPLLNEEPGDPDPTPQEAAAIKEKIEVLQGQAELVNKTMQKLNDEYKEFLATHPE